MGGAGRNISHGRGGAGKKNVNSGIGFSSLCDSLFSISLNCLCCSQLTYTSLFAQETSTPRNTTQPPETSSRPPLSRTSTPPVAEGQATWSTTILNGRILRANVRTSSRHHSGWKRHRIILDGVWIPCCTVCLLLVMDRGGFFGL